MNVQGSDTAVSISDYLQDAGMLRVLLDNIDDGVYFTDRQRRIQFWSRGAERITGYSSGEVVGKSCADNILMHVNDEGTCLCTSALCPLVKCFKGDTNHVERVYLHHKAGHRVPGRMCASPIGNAEGGIIGGLETFHDISAELAALQQVDALKEAALLCPLTGVGNRRYCEEFIRTQLQSLDPSRPMLAILFLDVDNFKSYNDEYGHNVGDIVLKMVARTLSKSLRAFDFVGRWGGEEFVAVLPRMDPAALEDTAERLRKLVKTGSADVSQNKLSVTVSIGATMARAGETMDKLVGRADELMYTSKATGKNKVTLG